MKAGYFLLKLVITNSLFSTGPPDSQSLPRSAQSTLLLPENNFSDEKYQKDLIAVLFSYALQYVLLQSSNSLTGK